MPRNNKNAKCVNRKIHQNTYKPPQRRRITGTIHYDDQDKEIKPEGYGVVLHGGYSHRWLGVG